MHRSQKCNKDSKVVVFFVLLGSVYAKAARGMLVKLTQGLNFINILTFSFYVRISQKRKKDLQLHCLFYAFGLCARKSCMQNVDEIDTRSPFVCVSLKLKSILLLLEQIVVVVT